MERHQVNFSDYERGNLKDAFSEGDSVDCHGRVQIYEHRIDGSGKKLFLIRDSTNLVVYRGRSWLAQRAANTSMSGYSGWEDMYISWFAIGTGGTVSGHPLTPSSPNLTNIELSNHGVIDSGMRYVTFDGKQYHRFDDSYPVFDADTEISASGLGNANDRKLKVRFVTTLSTDEANNDGGVSDNSAYQEISEAGLFVSDTNTISSPAPTKMQLFARNTFPTIKKTNRVELVFSWVIYF